MKIEFDPGKSGKNAHERDLPFDRAGEFEWETALYRKDDRREYAERRFVAVGKLEGRLQVLSFTPMAEGVRSISFRRANERGVRRYEEETAERYDGRGQGVDPGGPEGISPGQ